MSGHYRDQVVLGGVLSSTPQAFRILAGGRCVGVLATSYGAGEEARSEQTFDGGGSVRLRWQGREIVVGGGYHLATNMVNQLSVVEARLSALGFLIRASVVGTDRYRGSVTIFSGNQQIQSIPLEVPGPLSVSERAGGVFDVVAPMRSFRQSRSPSFADIIRLEPGTCNPTDSLDLSELLKRVPAPLAPQGLPLSLPFPIPEHP